MSLEDLTGTEKYIDDLTNTNPVASDPKSEGDDHIRGIKNVLKNSFSGVTGEVTSTHTELNLLDGIAAIKDEDNMASDSATSLATQQSIKAYVDATNELVEDTTPQLGGDLDCNGKQIQWSKGADVASATALPVLTDGNYFDVTGGTTITSINTTGGAGTLIKLHFDGALTLTHHATNLILPSGANITTAAGDEAEFVEYGAGTYRCTNYSKANGEAVIGGAGATGGGTDEVFYENGQTVTTNYTLTTNTNAMSAGDITINSGVTVTVPSGSNWVIV